jgi:hypothetical protein
VYSIFKFFYFLLRRGGSLLNPNLNPLRHAPPFIRYFATIILACFWCLAFGLYYSEFSFIAYNMLGHIAVITMVFTTWCVFVQSDRIYAPRVGTHDWLRMPDRSSRCDEMTDEERSSKANDLRK